MSKRDAKMNKPIMLQQDFIINDVLKFRSRILTACLCKFELRGDSRVHGFITLIHCMMLPI